jgi:hypothetical protein
LKRPHHRLAKKLRKQCMDGALAIESHLPRFGAGSQGDRKGLSGISSYARSARWARWILRLSSML